MRGCIESLSPETIERGTYYFEKFTNKELRLLPYLHYLAINTMKLDPAKLNSGEKSLYLRLKKDLGVIEGSITQPVVFTDKSFYDFTSNCLFYAYNAQS